MKKIAALGLGLLMAATTPISAFATQFTYTYDQWGIPTPSPDAYRVTAFLLGEDLGIGHFHSPHGLFVSEAAYPTGRDTLFIADTFNHRIVRIAINPDATFELIDYVNHIVIDGVPSTFNAPQDVVQTRWGDIFIADTENQRIIHTDANWQFINLIHQPSGSIEGFGDNFLPENIAVDGAGRVFVQARHVNRGLVEFDSEGYFTGFVGANEVEITPWDQFWRLIATQEQRARMQLTVPTEYSNVNMDHEGFLWVTSTASQGDAVRRLNSQGADVLIRNGRHDLIGDLWWADAGNIQGASAFIDSTMLPNGTVAVFDRTRGRIFNYDFQGNLLYVFGGVGNREGMFLLPQALDNLGYTLFALDRQAGAVTRFDLTNYGALINTALTYYRRGLYDESAATWQEVIRLNGNFGPAYIGIARSYLRLGYYQQAMHYFRLQDDYRNFGRAFGFYRQEWVERHFVLFASAIALIILVPPVVKKSRKIYLDILHS